jgi:hypothetical protein
MEFASWIGPRLSTCSTQLAAAAERQFLGLVANQVRSMLRTCKGSNAD